MRTGKLNVVKVRKITDPDSTFALGGFKLICDELVNDDAVRVMNDWSGIIMRHEIPARLPERTQTNQVPVPVGILDKDNVKRLLDTIEEHMEDALNGSLYEFPRKTIFPFERHRSGFPIVMNFAVRGWDWDRHIRTNDDPITETQLGELINRFRHVQTQTVRENFSRKFADFLIKVIDYYHVNVSEFGLRSDAYVANRVNFDDYHVNFQGDVQTSGWNEADSQFAILHEIRHVMQYLRGWLAPSGGGLFYQGHRCISAHLTNNYNTTPAEYDANRFTMESPLFTNKNLSEFMSIPWEMENASEFQRNRWNEMNG